MNLARIAIYGVLLCVSPAALAQEASGLYSRLNTFSGFTEYSNDSSHIILGDSENRKIGAVGFQYQRRLVNRRVWNFNFTVEARPGMIESDPTETQTQIVPPPNPVVIQGTTSAVVLCRAFDGYNVTISTPSGPITYVGQLIDTCGRRTVIEQGFSPAGLRINLMPRRRLQLTFSTFAGYMFSTQQVPIPNAGAFNYTFEFGGGLEFYRSHTNSMRLEYQVQHFSNKETGTVNPGVDSGFIKLTYAFGR
jgi:hypothetical protein